MKDDNKKEISNKIRHQKTGCLIIFIGILLFLNMLYRSNSEVTIDNDKNLMFNVGSELEKEYIKGIIAIKI